MPHQPPLLAFGITNLPMLGWLAVAAVPILIHLWSRRKYREMSWAAMEYLLAAVERQSRRLRLEQWLLLAIRTTLIVLIVLAVAEPYTERLGFAVTSNGNTHRLLVLDGSYSMDYKPTDKTRFERAKELARQIVQESPQGDGFTLVLMSSPPRVVVATPALGPDEIVREIDNLQIQHTSANLPATITTVRQVIENVQRENPRLAQHEVYFLTDLQRITWAPKLPDAAEFQRQAAELSQSATLFLIDLGQPQAENMTVTSLLALDPVITVNRPVSIEVELRNFGRQAHPRQLVELLVDRRRIDQKVVDVAAEGAAVVRFSHPFSSADDHAIEIRASGDALEIDNRRFLAVPVRQAIRTLCINGRPSGTPFHGAADYLAVALAPQADRATVQVEVAAESALLERNLTGYDCIFFCNVAQFTASEAGVLNAYLQGGGSLVFFLGDQVLADRYNSELGGAGQGGTRLLPAEIGSLIEKPQFRLDPLDYRHPILQPFRGRAEASLLTTPVLKHFMLTIPEGSAAKTVLAMASGDPLLIEEPIHRGRVFLFATSADPSWNAMPLWPSFVPLVQEIVARCAGGQIKQQNLMVGEPLDAPIPASAVNATLSVLGPDGRTYPAQLHAAGDDAALSYADTMQAGIYVARCGPPLDRNEIFAVNLDTLESDLTPIGPDELRNDVWPGVPFVHQTSWQDLGDTGPGVPIRSTSRLHISLLYAVLALLFVETFLAWKTGHYKGG